MHVQVRMLGKPDTIVAVESRLSKIEEFRKKIKEKFGVDPKLQRLFYGGKMLENGYTFHDYNIKINDVIQLMVMVLPKDTSSKSTPVESDKSVKEKKSGDTKKEEDLSADKDAVYQDGNSSYYEIGDFVDVRDLETGAWLEGKIIRIVHNPKATEEDSASNDSDKNEDKENKVGSPNKKNSITKQNKNESDIVSENLLFKIKLDDEEMDEIYCKFKDLRPRARTEIDVEYLKVGETVLINHNIDHPLEKGNWYDFKVANIEKRRNQYNLVGTLYLGQHAIPQDDTTVRVHDKIFRIEKPRLLTERSEEDKQLMKNAPEKRSKVLNCLKCRDVEDKPCNECGCYICCGKNDPENILLCDECNNGFHMSCLSPPMTEIPEEDWYCPSCKRDSNDVVAPGAAKQAKKTSATKSNRDWGRGMACVGKTKDCAMPANHFGPIPGIEVGMCWRFRFQASEVGVHRPLISGIHGRDEDGAYSIVLSGGYEDDVDNGEEFTYTGSGGRDLSGNKRTAVQSSDQKLTRQNKALARNCPVKLSESGGDAGENWQKGKPVRVIRSYKTLKHCEFAPVEGIRYDGIYKVVKYYPETGLSGFRVWKYLLRRDDPSPAPWAPDAKKFPIIYPDGFLEAEAEKKANKNKKAPGSTKKTNKRTLQSTENELPSKKRKTEAKGGLKEMFKKGLKTSPVEKVDKNKSKGSEIASKSLSDDETSTEDEKPLKNGTKDEDEEDDLPKRRTRQSAAKMKIESDSDEAEDSEDEDNSAKDKSTNGIKNNSEDVSKELQLSLSAEEMDIIKKDTRNNKLWSDCLRICEKKTKQEFIQHVTEAFLCIICQSMAVNPVTTPCLHNFCMKCIMRAFKTAKIEKCPYCRHKLDQEELESNEELRSALRMLLPGYDAGRQ